jgi:hypothetical protein
MRVGMRVVILLLALIPWLAPYELLLKIEWTRFVHPFFAFALLVSLGAVAVSALFAFAALAGLSSRIVLDAESRSITVTEVAPVIPLRTRVRPLSSVRGVEVETHDWSDGAPSYSLEIEMADGESFASGSSWSRDDVERARVRVEAFLARYVAPPEG